MLHKFFATLFLLAASANAAPIEVTADSFVRAETHLFFSRIAGIAGVGKFVHQRGVTNVDIQPVVRMNRDTLYSAAVFDLAASPVEISLPSAQGHFQSMQVYNEDEYSLPVTYQPGNYVLTQEMVGSRYAMVMVRTLVNPNDAADLQAVHALQDAIRWKQADPGRFEIPIWDPVSQKKIRESLFALSAGIQDSRGMFGGKSQVDPVRHLIGAAIGWGGNFEEDALYLMRTPAKNDGATVYKMHLDQVPVDGFWSVSVYNSQGYFQKNAQGAYSLNSLTVRKNPDGSADIQFGGCDVPIPNCLPTMPGWNYWVRLYLPRPEILNGSWHFPEIRE